eukprot:37353-Pyramimonas_sp.AAC.1
MVWGWAGARHTRLGAERQSAVHPGPCHGPHGKVNQLKSAGAPPGRRQARHPPGRQHHRCGPIIVTRPSRNVTIPISSRTGTLFPPATVS